VTPLAGGCTVSDCVVVDVESSCGFDEEAIDRLKLVKEGAAIRFHWDREPVAIYGYSVRTVTDARSCPPPPPATPPPRRWSTRPTPTP